MGTLTQFEKNKKLEFEMLIDEVENVRGENKFTVSCRDFLEDRGMLTEKQIDALKNILENYAGEKY